MVIVIYNSTVIGQWSLYWTQSSNVPTFTDFKSMPQTGDYETHVVQLAIEKITALLRVGFGVAGAEIISSNMAVEGGGSASLNPMIPGRRVYALFGFCDILSFDLCTEKLEDEIMTFVNN